MSGRPVPLQAVVITEMKADCAGTGRRGSRLSEVRMTERPRGSRYHRDES